MYSIGLVSKQSGVGIETIRFYEREGVIPAVIRGGNGRRLYDDAAIARLRFIKRCRDLGFSLDQIRELMALSPANPESCDFVRRTGTLHLEEIRKKISDLRRMESTMLDLLSHCDGNRRECPVLVQLFDDGELDL